MNPARGRPLRALAPLLACGVLLTGCVATGEYEAAVARGHALEHDLRQRDERVGELQRQNRGLLELNSRLELERDSLDAERIELLEELEDLREERERVSAELERERRLRLRREAELERLSGVGQAPVEEPGSGETDPSRAPIPGMPE
ncbi:MAG: hypothetical protein J4G09_09310 [Proteobacteria bacterium]|nr:hypothetical protein [Pseudomonadota bacterium]